MSLDPVGKMLQEMNRDCVCIEIGNVRYNCKKSKLVEHSAFFKAMFSGNFDQMPNSDDGLAYKIDFDSSYFEQFHNFFHGTD